MFQYEYVKPHWTPLKIKSFLDPSPWQVIKRIITWAFHGYRSKLSNTFLKVYHSNQRWVFSQGEKTLFCSFNAGKGVVPHYCFSFLCLDFLFCQGMCLPPHCILNPFLGPGTYQSLAWFDNRDNFDDWILGGRKARTSFFIICGRSIGKKLLLACVRPFSCSIFRAGCAEGLIFPPHLQPTPLT